MGISKKDLEYMQKISGSKNNKEKQKIIRQMPEWMRPSGEFGIGLHSAFLLMKDLPYEEQKITIFTKSRLTHESLRVELNSPLSGKNGYCFIEEIKDLGRYGSKVVISTLIKKIILDDKFDKAKVSKVISDKSIYQYSSGSVEIAQTLKSIANKISTSLFKINFTGSSLNIIESLDIKKRKTRIFYWDSEQETALNISVVDHKDIAKVEADQMLPIGINIYYRGQFVESLHEYELEGILKKYSSYRFIGINIDIYKNSASKFLSLNRNTLQNKNDVLKIITSSLNNIINESQKQESIVHDMVKNSPKYSLLSNVLSMETNHSISESIDWLRFKVSKDHNLSDILDLNAFTVNPETLEKSSIDKVSLIDGYLIGGIIKTKFIKDKLKDKGFIPYLRVDEERRYWPDVENIIFSKNNLNLKDFEICDFYSNNSGLPTISLKKFYQISLIRIQDNFAPKNLFINLTRIDGSLFPNSDSSQYSKITINKDDKQFILIPFMEHKKMVIMIDNDKLYDSLKAYLEIDFPDFIELYNSLKKHIVDNSKTLNPEWYKAYVNGKLFKPTDLKPLEELHESS